MSAVAYAGTPVELDEEGFFKQPLQWTEEMAREIAIENGIPELTERHWQAIKYLRSTYLESGSAPPLRVLGKVSGVPPRELYQLFPHGPAMRQVAKIAGIPKPKGCL
jgi:TusE/DsrC/DsvC family sulfur relay protein